MKSGNKKSAALLNNAINFRKIIFDKIAQKDPDQACFTNSLSDVKKALIIDAAPRSGSSLLFAILKKIPGFYSLSGESTPFYRLNATSFERFDCDEIPAGFKISGPQRVGLSRDLLNDSSVAVCEIDIFGDNRLLERYIDELALRFSMQWPQVNFSYDVFISLASRAFDLHKEKHRKFSKEEFYLELLWLLNKEYKDINPYYYDIPAELIAQKFPLLKAPLAPPNVFLMIEEPPFILLSPGKKADRNDLKTKTLLLKSSVDSYRMPFIEALMPNAEIKIIYLTRNPASSINGLYDGWLYRGFFSHNLKYFFDENKDSLGLDSLKISGYSDIFEWGKWWWKYDLPCGWQSYAQSKLEEVCAFQWHSANLSIRRYLDKSKKQYCRITYEDIISGLEKREAAIEKIMEFVGIEDNVKGQLELNNLSVVQATEAPSCGRWKKRKGLLLPVINTPKISEMAGLLGYDKNNIEEWF